MKSDKKKSSVIFSNAVLGTVDAGKKVVSSAKSGLTTILEKSRKDLLSRKIKKYNPLFPEQYSDENFNIPNMIVIVDDAVRKNIAVCEGAIGWLSNDSGMETLYLYDEAVEFSGIQFVPTVTCDAVYYVDNFDRNRFIRTDCIFSKAHEEKLAELKHIAFSLGAKHCRIEIEEEESDQHSQSKGISSTETYKGFKTNESAEQKTAVKGRRKRSGVIEISFEGCDTPERPVLKWFIHDDTINNLIEMRCSGNNQIRTESLVLFGSSSATMSQKTACAIDSAIGKIGGIKGQLSLDAQAAKEHSSKLMFEIEF